VTRALIATDLDRTLIYSAAAAGSVPAAELVTVEHLDGRAISFMTATAAQLMARLSGEQMVVPVTTRTPAQLARVRLPGPSPRFAIAANGGVLLVDGRPDADWADYVQTAVGTVAPLDAAFALLTEVCNPDWAAQPRVAAELFCYVVVDRAAIPVGALERVEVWARSSGWSVSLQGRKLYLVPNPLCKSAAVAEVARRSGADVVLAAGDSLLDVDMLEAADFGVRPGHGEIAESGWTAAHVDALRASGAVAGEQVLRWFSDQAKTLATTVSCADPTGERRLAVGRHSVAELKTESAAARRK
jgi:hypothetical protein